MVSTAAGSRPSSPKAWRSSKVKAVPLFTAGVSSSARPRRFAASRVGIGWHLGLMDNGREPPRALKESHRHVRLERKERKAPQGRDYGTGNAANSGLGFTTFQEGLESGHQENASKGSFKNGMIDAQVSCARILR